MIETKKIKSPLSTLDIINHIRLVNLGEFHAKMDKLSLGHYAIVASFLLSLETDPNFRKLPK